MRVIYLADSNNSKKLKYGMIGGAADSLIGDVHRKAARLDGRIQLVAGAFSRDYDKTLSTGSELGLSNDRLYKDYIEMAAKESAREDRLDFVSIVTRNNTHYPIAKTFLNKGFHVICDKPLTLEIDQAEELSSLAKKKGLLFAVTYTYSGYPMVKHAKEMIKNGDIGDIRVVMGEYPQQWFSKEEAEDSIPWRADPKYSGRSNCVADIGSHIENTVSYITGLEIDRLCANLDSFSDKTVLDNNAEVMVKYKKGASGVYWSSQVAIGNNNGLKVRIYGTKGSIEWYQERANELKVALLGKPVQTLNRGADFLYPLASRASNIPPGHPEGYYEAFANIYKNIAESLYSLKSGEQINVADYDYPSVDDGVNGVKFIHACVDSMESGAAWVKMEDY